ncbi:MAG: twin-arginine translocase TatA/TatE family subunit [Chloroflexota bacterium]
MPTLGVWELVVILVIVVVIFGAGRLSEVGGAVGKGIREFRKATTDEHAPQAPAVRAAPPAEKLLPLAPVSPSVVVTTVVVDNRCPSCNTVNPTGQVFCGQCGIRLTLAA